MKMTEIIEVDPDNIDLLNMDAEPQDIVNMLNGIVYDCQFENGYSEGWRNQVAVDLVVGCTLLGIEYEDVLDKLVDADVINPSIDDDEDTYRRFDRVMGYKDNFSWGWMVDPDAYMGHDDAFFDRFDMAVRFKLV